MDIKQIKESNSEKEIDLVELGSLLWNKRGFLLKCCVISVFVGLIIGFSMPKEYETKVKFAPENSDLSKSAGALGGLAAMAGINLKQGTGSDAISPDLYPEVIKSTPFLIELFPMRVVTQKEKDSMLLYDYISEHQRGAWWGYIMNAPFMVIGWVKGVFSDKSDMIDANIDPFNLTPAQSGVVNALRSRILIQVDKKTPTLEISVRMQDPLISANVAQVVLENLQKYMTNYRIHKVKQDMEYTEKVYGEAQEAYYKAQKAYATFEDSNKNIISANYRTEQERLKNEMTLTFNVYNSLAQKLEQDKLRVQEETPVYTIIEPATVPLAVASPKKTFILVVCIFLAILGGCVYVLVKDFFSIKKEENTDISGPEFEKP